MNSDFQSQGSLAAVTSDFLQSELLHTSSNQPSLFCMGQTPPPQSILLVALDPPPSPHCRWHPPQLNPRQRSLLSSHLNLEPLSSLRHFPSSQGTPPCRNRTRIQCRRFQKVGILRRQKCWSQEVPPLGIIKVRKILCLSFADRSSLYFAQPHLFFTQDQDFYIKVTTTEGSRSVTPTSCFVWYCSPSGILGRISGNALREAFDQNIGQ